MLKKKSSFDMKPIFFLILLLFFSLKLNGQLLPGFSASGLYDEQQMLLEDSPAGTRILINAPLKGFGPGKRVLLIFFALPNGNSIEWTTGKKLSEGDDWHYNIQHIGAQTRFLRSKIKDRTVVVVSLQAQQKSWGQWVANTPDSLEKIKGIVDNITSMFSAWNPDVQLNSHSGGGRFIFSYIDAVESIPEKIKGITFMDSNYGYEDTISGPKILRWLKTYPETKLCVLAYNDSVVIYNGKQLVSPTGGTWYRSKMMKNYLSGYFDFKVKIRDSVIWNSTRNGRIEILLKDNPEGKIYHTIQVERNGFIHSTVHGTRIENRGYRYFGKRAYGRYIGDTVIMPIRRLNIPERKPGSETGKVFMARIDTLSLADREEEIFKAVSSGNIPEFLRNLVTLRGEFADSAGIVHKVTYEVMPDYIAIGNDSDFCRIPMNPYTAQRIATIFGASLVTSKVSDHIYANAEVKLIPFNYVPVGNQNELVAKFVDHNAQIERQMMEAGGKNGQLVAGIQKDIILSSRIAKQPGKVVIYGWHKPDGVPIQPVYSGHIWWYVDYSHGIRLINNQVLIDGKPCLFSNILQDPVLFRIFSNEPEPMRETTYYK
jgi:hypothetical protein